VSHGVTLTFASSLLQLRGSKPTETPFVDETSGNVLLWNGEIFGGIAVPPHANDGHRLMQVLTAVGPDRIPLILSSLLGPWACVFWHARFETLYFGRDVLGRRSLLIKEMQLTGTGRALVLSSSASLDPSIPSEGFEELTPGIYSVTFSDTRGADTSKQLAMKSIPWENDSIEAIARFQRSPELVRAPPPPSLNGNGGREVDAHPLPEQLESAANGVLKALRAAVFDRCRCIETAGTENKGHAKSVCEIDPGGEDSSDQQQQKQKARILILFSGGVDSTLIAALVDEALPEGEPIDLLSICFAEGTSPDRFAALNALTELRAISPTRPWRLIGANRSLSDVEASRAHLLRLLAPCDTVMDFNIGAALWLAAAGVGVVLSSLNEGEWYCSPARVVLMGHGADELFGGYGRHRTKFRTAGWQGLSDELALDVRRLWIRNLGRDDRLIADRGREARHPFLDEGVILEALKHPLHALVDLRLPLGVGDKLVLRECLRRLGLPEAAAREKRAIQFGTRLAKAANVAHFGGTRRANAKNAGSVRLGDALSEGGTVA